MVIYISIDFVKVNLQSASYELTSQKSTHHLIEDEISMRARFENLK